MTNETRRQIAEKVGNGLTDKFRKQSMLLERERCGKMLAEYIATGATDAEIVAYAQSLLRTDY